MIIAYDFLSHLISWLFDLVPRSSKPNKWLLSWNFFVTTSDYRVPKKDRINYTIVVVYFPFTAMKLKIYFLMVSLSGIRPKASSIFRQNRSIFFQGKMTLMERDLHSCWSVCVLAIGSSFWLYHSWFLRQEKEDL